MRSNSIHRIVRKIYGHFRCKTTCKYDAPENGKTYFKRYSARVVRRYLRQHLD